MRVAGHVALIGGMRYTYEILVRKPEGKRPFARPRYRWEETVRMNLREIG
jgi:hypothetical protein